MDILNMILVVVGDALFVAFVVFFFWLSKREIAIEAKPHKDHVSHSSV